MPLRQRRTRIILAPYPLLALVFGLGYILAVYVGFFLFLGATDLLPEAHSHPSWRRVFLTVAGFGATFAIAFAASR